MTAFKCFLAALLLLGSALVQANGNKPPPPAPAPSPDPPRTFWLTPDNDGGRTAHIGISAVIGMGLRFNDRAAPWWDRTAWCMLPGAAKELRDYAGGSGVSRRDLRNNLLGCLGGVAVGSGLIYLTRDAGGAPAVALSIPLR